VLVGFIVEMRGDKLKHKLKMLRRDKAKQFLKEISVRGSHTDTFTFMIQVDVNFAIRKDVQPGTVLNISDKNDQSIQFTPRNCLDFTNEGTPGSKSILDLLSAMRMTNEQGGNTYTYSPELGNGAEHTSRSISPIIPSWPTARRALRA